MRIVLIAITVIGLGVAWNCASDPPLPSETDTLKLITEGVWFRMGEREHGHCNNVVIDVGEGLLVVDANFPSGAQALMEDIKQVTSKPVSYVFDTHHHGDHAYANAVWTRAGATTLAHIGVAEEMKRYEPARWQQAAQSREDVAAVGEDTVQPPQKTFRPGPARAGGGEPAGGVSSLRMGPHARRRHGLSAGRQDPVARETQS